MKQFCIFLSFPPTLKLKDHEAVLHLFKWAKLLHRHVQFGSFPPTLKLKDFLGPQDPEGSTSLILIKPGTINWVPGRIKMYSVSCVKSAQNLPVRVMRNTDDNWNGLSGVLMH